MAEDSEKTVSNEPAESALFLPRKCTRPMGKAVQSWLITCASPCVCEPFMTSLLALDRARARSRDEHPFSVSFPSPFSFVFPSTQVISQGVPNRLSTSAHGRFLCSTPGAILARTCSSEFEGSTTAFNVLWVGFHRSLGQIKWVNRTRHDQFNSIYSLVLSACFGSGSVIIEICSFITITSTLALNPK